VGDSLDPRAKKGRLRSLRAVDRRDEDAALADARDAGAVGRDGRVVALTEKLRCAGGGRHSPHLYLGLNRAPRRIGRIGGPIRAMVAAAHVDDRLAVGRHRQLRQLLAVVSGIGRESSGREGRGVGGVDVAHAALVEGPDDCRAGRRRHEIVGSGEAEDLIDREGRRGRRQADRQRSRHQCRSPSHGYHGI